MNKMLCTIFFTTPLLFTACNSTNEVTPKVEKNIQVVQQATVRTIQKQVPAPMESKTTTVTYVNGNKMVKDVGVMNIDSYMTTMKSTLMGLMKSDSTYKTALGACSSIGPSMADDYNKISEVKVRRTALKYRNPKNKPDETDTIVMEHFLDTKDFKEAQVVDMGDHYRVYKALTIKQPCLICHGQNISPDLRKILDKRYPKDMATNFKLGEFRGAVVAKIKK